MRVFQLALLLATCLLAASAFGQGTPNVVWSSPGVLSGVTSVVTSPNGDLVAYSDFQCVKIIRLSDRKLVRTFYGEAGKNNGTISCAFSPDGLSFAYNWHTGAYGAAERIVVVRLSDGVVEHTFDSPTDNGGETIFYSPNGRYLAKERIWDLTTDTVVQLRDSVGGLFESKGVLTFSPTSQSVIMANAGGASTAQFSLPNGTFIRAFQQIPFGTGGKISPDGSKLALSGPTSFQVFDFNQNKLYPQNPSQNFPTAAVDWSSDGTKLLATGISSGIVRVYDVPTFQISATHIEDNSAGYTTLAKFSPDGTHVVSSSRGVHRWAISDPNNAEELTPQYTDDGSVGAIVAYSPNGKYIATGAYTNQARSLGVRIRDANTGVIVRTLNPRNGDGLRAMAWAPDGRRLVLGFAGNQTDAELWDTETGLLTKTFSTGAPISSLSVSKGNYLALLSGALHVFNLNSNYHQTRTGVTGPVSFSSDGSRLLVGYMIFPDASGSGSAFLDPLHLGVFLQGFKPGSILSHAQARGGSKLAFGRFSVTGLYDLTPLSDERTVDGSRADTAQVLAFTGDGGIFLAGDSTATLKFRDTSNGAVLKTFDTEVGQPTSSTSGITSFSFSPDGKRIAYGRVDGTAVVIENPFPAFKSLIVPSFIESNIKGIGTVTLDGLAPVGGLTVSLSASPAGLVTMPTSVFIPAGRSNASFPMKAPVVNAETGVVIRGQLFGATRTAATRLAKASLVSLASDPVTLVAGASTKVTANLSSLTGSAGSTVSLLSDAPAILATPPSISIAPARVSGLTTLTSKGVDSDTLVTVSGSLDGITKTCAVMVKAASLGDLSLPSLTVTGGTTVQLTMSFTGQVGPGGGTVTFGSSALNVLPNPAAAPVGAFAQSLKKAIKPKVVTTASDVTISVTYRGVTKTIMIHVIP